MTDKSDGRLNEMKEFAAKNNLQAQLDDILDRLKRREDNGYEVYLYTDFAPLSLYFVTKGSDGSFAGNGGVIFHGKHDNGGDGSSPTFSVNLTPHNGWAIHT